MRQEFPALKQTLIPSEVAVLLQPLSAQISPSPAAPVPCSWALGAPQDHARGGHCPAMAFTEQVPKMSPGGDIFQGSQGVMGLFSLTSPASGGVGDTIPSHPPLARG